MARIVLALLTVVMLGCASPVQKAAKALDEKARADQAYRAGNCDQAVALYRSLLGKYSDMREPWLRVGNCLARKKDLFGAEQAYRQVLVIDPDNAKAWFNLTLVQSQGLAMTVLEMERNVPASDPVRAKVDALLGATLAQVSKSVAQAVQQSAREQRDTEEELQADSRSAYQAIEKSALVRGRKPIKNLKAIEFTPNGRVIVLTASNKEVVLSRGERIVLPSGGYDMVSAVLAEQGVVLIGEDSFIDTGADEHQGVSVGSGKR